MNGIHDMGGMQDMGPIRPEKDEPVFRAVWEGRMFALEMAVDGDWPYGASRHQRDLIPPADYLRMSYYEKWLTGLVELMVKAFHTIPYTLTCGTIILNQPDSVPVSENIIALPRLPGDEGGPVFDELWQAVLRRSRGTLQSSCALKSTLHYLRCL
jgi:nitrile hydratase